MSGKVRGLLPLNPPLHPSQEGNLQPVLQTKLPSSEGLGVGSWPGRRSEWNREPSLTDAPTPITARTCFFPSRVARSCTLSYRRFAIGRAPDDSDALDQPERRRIQFCDTAD